MRSVLVPVVFVAVICLAVWGWQFATDQRLSRQIEVHEQEITEAGERLDGHDLEISDNRVGISKNSETIARESGINEAQAEQLGSLKERVEALKLRLGQQQQQLEKNVAELGELPRLRKEIEALTEAARLHEDDRRTIQELSDRLDELMTEREDTRKRLELIEQKLGLIPDP